MNCHQHDFTPWINIPQNISQIQIRRCYKCDMEVVRFMPRSWVTPHPQDVYDRVDYDYDPENTLLWP